MKLLLIPFFFVLILFSLPFSFAHESDSESDAEVDIALGPAGGGSNDLSNVNPFLYFRQGKVVEGLFFLAMWCGILWGIYELLMMQLGRLLVSKK